MVSVISMKLFKNVKDITHFPLAELWLWLDVSAVAGHGAVLAALLFPGR